MAHNFWLKNPGSFANINFNMPAPTGVDIYVDTDVSGGLGDGTSWANAYSTLNAAIAARAANIVNLNVYHDYHCRASSGTGDSTAIASASWASYVTSSTCKIRIIGEDAVAGKRSTASYRLIGNSTNNVYTAQNVEFTNIQFDHVGYSATCVYCYIPANSLYIFDKCIFAGDDGGTSTAMLAIGVDSTAVLVMNNCIATKNYVFLQNVAGTTHVQSCSHYSTYSTANGINVTSGTVYATNFITYLTGASANPFNGTVTAESCASYPADSVGTNYVSLSGYTLAQVYTDAANHDLHLVSGCPAIGAGYDLSGATYPITDDIDGDERSSWDIGADEYTSVASDVLKTQVIVCA